jgi:peptidyl-prolyl cis-trans isomerase C
MMQKLHLTVLFAAALAAVLHLTVFGTAFGEATTESPVAAAEEAAPEQPLGSSTEPLAIQSGVTLTQGEIDAAFTRIPADRRLIFIRNGERVDQLIRTLLQSKILAAEARRAGFDREPLVGMLLELEADQALADAWVNRVMEQAPEADYEALAYEYYLANPERWQTVEMVDVSHLLVSSENKSEEKALELAQSLRARLEENPADFEALVEEYSEDPSKSSNQGRFPTMKRGQMVASFEEAAFSLATEGEISQPVQTDYGYHLIRLNRKIPSTLRPFEAVRETAIQTARDTHLAQYRKSYMLRHLADPIEIPEGAVEAMAKRYFGENLESAPAYEN